MQSFGFGEGMALLAGNALLVEAFSFLCHSYSPNVLHQLLPLLCQSIGAEGMMLGQALDISYPSMESKESHRSLDVFQKMIFLKTGALLQAACLCSAILAQAEPSVFKKLKAYSYCLGMAFQVADDLLDKDPEKSFYALLGADATKEKLKTWSAEAIQHLESLENSHSLSLTKLKQMVQYNEWRVAK